MTDTVGDRVFTGFWWIGTAAGLALLALLWLAFLGFADNMSASPANGSGVLILRLVVLIEVSAVVLVIAMALQRRRWRSLPRRSLPWAAWALVSANFGLLITSHFY